MERRQCCLGERQGGCRLATPLADGAQIRYRSGDPALVDAVHRWVEAQLADHGPHAPEP